MTLEGGYNLQGLQESVKAVLRELAGLQVTDIGSIMAGADAKMLAVLLWRVRRIHGRHWKTLERALKNGSDPEPSITERLRETMARIMAYLRS